MADQLTDRGMARIWWIFWGYSKSNLSVHMPESNVSTRYSSDCVATCCLFKWQEDPGQLLLYPSWLHSNSSVTCIHIIFTMLLFKGFVFPLLLSLLEVSFWGFCKISKSCKLYISVSRQAPYTKPSCFPPFDRCLKQSRKFMMFPLGAILRCYILCPYAKNAPKFA